MVWREFLRFAVAFGLLLVCRRSGGCFVRCWLFVFGGGLWLPSRYFGMVWVLLVGLGWGWLNLALAFLVVLVVSGLSGVSVWLLASEFYDLLGFGWFVFVFL